METTANAPRPRKKSRLWKWVLWIVGGLLGLVLLIIATLALSATARDWTATRILTDGMVLRGRLAGVPTRSEAQPVQRLMLRMRDGAELSTQIFLPAGEGPWPVIVVRDPYSFAQYFSCKVFVRYDYACVYQEVRGRGPSQGTWYPFIDEREDGLDTLNWILQQPWQNGRLALHGGSYVGVVQWAVAGDLPEEVKTFVPAVAHGDVYQTAYRNGLFNQGVSGPWLHSQFRSVIGQFTSTGNWRENVAGHFPATGVDPAEFGKTWMPYRDYILHPERDDPYWQSPAYVALREAHRNVKVPVLMIGYFNDFFLPGMLQTFEALPTRDQSVFMIGPGNHGGQAEDEVAGTYTQDYTDTLAWFDHHLKGTPLPDRLKPGINVYVHGADSWQHFERWPEPSRTLVFNLDDLAEAQACDGGALTSRPPSDGQSARYAYDPRDPVPTLGGAFVLIDNVAPAAVEEQGDTICARADVLSFSSEPLPVDALVLGGIQVRLQVASDAADTAFTVKLSEHFADGRVYNIRDDASTLSLRNGARRRMEYQPGDKVEIVFDLTPIAWQLRAGSRLRLDVSSSNWPAFFPHPNRAGLWSEIADPVVAQQTIFSGSVEIPVQGRP